MDMEPRGDWVTDDAQLLDEIAQRLEAMALFCAYCLNMNRNASVPLHRSSDGKAIGAGAEAQVAAHRSGETLSGYDMNRLPMLAVTTIGGTAACAAHIEIAIDRISVTTPQGRRVS